MANSNQQTQATEGAPKSQGRPITWRDYYELTKPKVVYLLVFTAVVGMFLANDVTQSWFPPLNALIFGTLGIAFASGAAAVVNHVVDARIDTMMARTMQRPVAQGRLLRWPCCGFWSIH